MSFSRRFFLRGIPVAPMLAKTMANGVAETVNATLVSSSDDEDDEWEYSYARREAEHATNLLDVIEKHGIPEWRRDQIRQRARRHRQLDPDIAALGSLPIASRVRMQWERNEQRLIEDERKGLLETLTKSSWLAKIGLKRW